MSVGVLQLDSSAAGPLLVVLAHALQFPRVTAVTLSTLSEAAHLFVGITKTVPNKDIKTNM